MNSTQSTSKHCSAHSRFEPLENFTKDKSKALGLASACREALKERRRAKNRSGTDMSLTDHKRIWRHIKSCVPYGGALNSKRYSVVGGFGTNKLGHRLMWEWFHDSRIPEGMDLDHTCQTRDCINPSHVEPVTRKEHCRRTRERSNARWLIEGEPAELDFGDDASEPMTQEEWARSKWLLTDDEWLRDGVIGRYDGLTPASWPPGAVESLAV